MMRRSTLLLTGIFLLLCLTLSSCAVQPEDISEVSQVPFASKNLEEQDADIPEIIIKAAGVPVPYTAIKRKSDEETKVDREGKWFCSMVENQAEPVNIPEGTEVTIEFSEVPDGEIVFVDHNLLDISPEYGVGVSSFGSVYREADTGFERLMAENTKRLTADSNGKIVFPLWEHQYQMEEYHLPTFQRLRGMQIKCCIDNVQYEYYFIFTPYE